MRTKWQSGSAVGNAAPERRKGNRPIGNEGCVPGKSSPYLSRKIYLAGCRRLAFFARALPSHPFICVWNRREDTDMIRKRLLSGFGTVCDGAGDALFDYLAGDELRAWT